LLILSSGVSPPACPVPSEKITMFLGICVTICAELILHEKAPHGDEAFVDYSLMSD
jgi:hypothetical protein